VVVPRGFELPAELAADSMVLLETTADKKGRQVLSSVALVDPDEARAVGAQPVTLVDPGTVYSINAIPFGGFVRMRGEDGPAGPGSFASASRTGRAVTLLAGPMMNLVLAILLFTTASLLGRPEPVPGGSITLISPGSPAELAGLQTGDLVFKIGSQEVVDAGDLSRYMDEHPGEPVTLSIQRGGEMMTLSLTPRQNPPPGEGRIGVQIEPTIELRRFGLLESVMQGVEDTARFTQVTLSVPALLLRGVITPEEARPVGPKGIYDLTSGAIQQSRQSGWLYPILLLMGILSLALAITNLLPLPALDGGRLMFVIIEKIRGRRVDPNWEGAIHLAGMVLLLGLMVIITYQDFASPVPLPDWLGPLGQ
jgi:regulator of sigma E protease